MGRRKLEMKMVENRNSRQVIFSKRRNGLFKKASELVTLCGVEVALLAFSPGNKPFSYGHPSADVLFDRFLNNGGAASDHRLASECSQEIGKLNRELADLQDELETETRRSQLLDRELEAQKLRKVKKSSADSLEADERGNLHDMSKNEKEACSTLLLLSEEYVKKA